jgi:hypothetical protein
MLRVRRHVSNVPRSDITSVHWHRVFGDNRKFVRLPGSLFALKYPSARCDKLILLSTKPLYAPDATVLKPLPSYCLSQRRAGKAHWDAPIVRQGDHGVQSRIGSESARLGCRRHNMLFERSRAACARCRFVGHTCRGTHSGSAATSMPEAELDECRSYLPVVDHTAQQHESDNSRRNLQRSK